MLSGRARVSQREGGNDQREAKEIEAKQIRENFKVTSEWAGGRASVKANKSGKLTEGHGRSVGDRRGGMGVG